MTDQRESIIDANQSTNNVEFSVTGTHINSDIRILGQVKWFNTKSGFGFITVCKKEPVLSEMDIFVHYSSLNVINNQYRYLVQGEYVEFNVVKPDNDKYEFHAVNVSGVQEGTIMCEIRKQNMDSKQQYSLDVSDRKTHVKQSHYINNDLNTSNERDSKNEDDGDFQTVRRGKNRPKKTLPK